MDQKFQDFLMTVPTDEQRTVIDINDMLTENGCEFILKEAKQGYVVSYTKKINKKKVTILNFVFRKTGVKIRLYAANVAKYEHILNTLPENMKEEIIAAGSCKRLLNPDDCNAKCQMGYTFTMDGVEYKKCRYGAFMPTLTGENDSYIMELIKSELAETSK